MINIQLTIIMLIHYATHGKHDKNDKINDHVSNI